MSKSNGIWNTGVWRGGNRFWDDVYTEPSEVDLLGGRPPIRKQFRDDGVGGTDTALNFNGSTQYGQATLYSAYETALESGDYTIEGWLSPATIQTGKVLFSNPGEFEISQASSAIRARIGTAAFLTSAVNMNIAAYNHIIFSFDSTANIVTIYVNGVPTEIANTNIPAITTNIFIGAKNATPLAAWAGIMDLLTVYDTPFTQAQVDFRFNNGAGTLDLPAGITDSNRVLYSTFNEGSGATAGNTKGSDFSLVGSPTWPAGQIGRTGSLGIFLFAFEYSQQQSIGFSQSLPHGYTLRSEVRPHLHFALKETPAASKTIKFSFEYCIGQIDGTFPTTTIINCTYTTTGSESPYQHIIVSFPAIPMTSIVKVSTSILGTIKRTTDTYENDVFLVNYGLHYQSDLIGSRKEFKK